MKKVLGIFLGLIAVLIIGIIGFTAFPGAIEDAGYDAAENTKAAAANVAIDASGLKQQAADALESHRGAIADATGMSPSQVDDAIAKLDIEGWQACALPKDAQSTGSFSSSYSGIDATVTTYADPSYVTVKAQGQTVTLAVPDSAQEYIPFLQYL